MERRGVTLYLLVDVEPGATSAIRVTFIKHHWIKSPLNQRLRSWECMEACTKAVGAGWTSGGTIDRWDLSPLSRRLVHCHSVWMATLGTSDASLWAHESMGLHLPPLGESTNVIQGWGIVLGCFPWVLPPWQGLVGP